MINNLIWINIFKYYPNVIIIKEWDYGVLKWTPRWIVFTKLKCLQNKSLYMVLRIEWNLQLFFKMNLKIIIFNTDNPLILL